jgi:hypothetical protein
MLLEVLPVTSAACANRLDRSSAPAGTINSLVGPDFGAMNDWRSTFAGVNDHEADWEQITLFLAEPAPGGIRSWPRWPSRLMTSWATTSADESTTLT